MTGVIELIENGGAFIRDSEIEKSNGNTPRKKGLKKGLFIFLLTFLVVPIISIITIAVNAEPFAVVISAILLSIGGLLRMAYAWLFESNEGAEEKSSSKIIASAQNLIGKKQSEKALPPQQTIPAETYIPPTQGNWRDTNDLVQTSVTEETTKLLEKDL
jgi:hypothetical protein